MSNDLKLTTYGIADIGDIVSQKLGEYNVHDASLVIKLPAYEFSKVDEDLFYRNKVDDSIKYAPSDDSINISFDNVKIVVIKNKS